MKNNNNIADRAIALPQFRALLSSTLKEIWRANYFQVWTVVATILFQGYYFSYVQFEQLFAIHSAALGINNTTFFFGNLPTYIFPILQVSAVVFALVTFRKYARRDELHTRLCSNFTVLISCAVGASVSVFVVVLLNVLLIFLSTLLASLTNVTFGNIPTVLPALIFLLLDLPVTLLFWSCLSFLVALVIRNSPMAFVVIFIAAISAWILSLLAPFDWLVVLSSYSYNTMIVSDLAPRLPDFTVVLSRATAAIAAIGCCVLSARFWRRQDVKHARYVYTGLVTIAVASIAFAAQVWQINAERTERQEWAIAHALYDSTKIAQLMAMSGNVTIRPGVRLDLDLKLTLVPPSNLNVPELVFSFNPDMNIHRLQLNEAESDFSFEHGVLAIKRDCNPCSEEGNIVLSIQASGLPNVRFGYLVPEVDYLHSTGRFLQLRKLFGTHNALFDKRFVALMPGIRWYPVPGLLSVDKRVEALVRAPDLFDVDLNVKIERPGWIVVGPGRQLEHSHEESVSVFRPDHEITHFGIVASEFEPRTAVDGDVTIDMLVHQRHADTIDSMGELSDQFEEYLAQRLATLANLGVRFKNPKITFVEVPNDLRMVGGYGMDFVNSLPGLVLVRESSLPLSNVDDTKRFIRSYRHSEQEIESALFAHIQRYARSNGVRESLVEAFARQLHPYTYRQFTEDNVSLNYLRRLSISEALAEGSYVYVDADQVARFARLTKANPITLFDHSFLGDNYSYYPLSLDIALDNYLEMSEAAEIAQSRSLRDLVTSTDLINNRKTLYWKSSSLYHALQRMFGDDTLHKIIEPMVRRDDLEGYGTVEYIYQAASSSGLNLGPFVREWLTTDGIPSFRTSPMDVSMVTGGENEPQYHMSFDIRNDSDTHGVVQFRTIGEMWSEAIGEAKEVPPHTSFRVNLYSSRPVQFVSVANFFSLNAGNYEVVPSISEENTEIVQPSIRPLFEASSWVPSDDEYIVVDNLDLGTRVLADTENRLKMADNILGLLDLTPHLTLKTRNNVGYSLQIAPLYVKNRWTYEFVATAYGKYDRSVFSTHSSSAPTVRFTTELPSSGEWSLEYHFPYLYSHWEQYGRYNFTLRDNRQEWDLSVDANSLHGWIGLGTFDISGPDVELDLISVEPANSIRVADAIRWKRLE